MKGPGVAVGLSQVVIFCVMSKEISMFVPLVGYFKGKAVEEQVPSLYLFQM
jgi:hypothetical protein